MSSKPSPGWATHPTTRQAWRSPRRASEPGSSSRGSGHNSLTRSSLPRQSRFTVTTRRAERTARPGAPCRQARGTSLIESAPVRAPNTNGTTMKSIWVAALLGLLLLPKAAFAQAPPEVTPNFSVTPTKTVTPWVYQMAVGAVVVAALILIFLVVSYLRFSPKFFGKEAPAAAVPPGTRSPLLQRAPRPEPAMATAAAAARPAATSGPGTATARAPAPAQGAGTATAVAERPAEVAAPEPPAPAPN